jgi:hypothetical protein
MADSNSVINLGELSKPVSTLIEKISDAIGGIFQPHQIRRIAQAEAEAEKIRAVSEIEISNLQRRALQRFLVEEAKKQNNIETITRKALPGVSEQAAPHEIEDDWITNFFDKCRLISDDEMQNLWARVLAGEANAPGKYSKRTVNLLADLDKVDAETFARVCSFGVTLGKLTPLVYDIKHRIYMDRGVIFTSLSHLESIGLIHFDALAGYAHLGLGQQGTINYYGTPVWIGFDKSEQNSMNIGHVMLTKAGEQLAFICGSQPVDGFVEYLREKWKGLGYKVDPDAVDDIPVEPSQPAT